MGATNLYQQKARQVAAILKQSHPQKIVLFGSGAGGRVTKESDLDICLVKDGNPLEIKKSLWKLLRDAGYDWEIEPDIHVFSPSRFADYLRRGDPFVEEISKGKVLYELCHSRHESPTQVNTRGHGYYNSVVADVISSGKPNVRATSVACDVS